MFSEMSGEREPLEDTGSPLARGSGKADIQPVRTRHAKIKMLNDHQTVGQWLLLRALPSLRVHDVWTSLPPATFRAGCPDLTLRVLVWLGGLLSWASLASFPFEGSRPMPYWWLNTEHHL